MSWVLHFYDELESTNDEASRLHAWNAVIAKRQSRGRGRFGRPWQSQLGGLWLSAVVPADIDEPGLWPLVAGEAVARAWTDFGAKDVRLRWPNDVLVRNRKGAGILVDRFHSDRCVVGIGINVFNDPSTVDPELKGLTTRMVDEVTSCPTVMEVGHHVLDHLRRAFDCYQEQGGAYLEKALKPFWGAPRPVEIRREGATMVGSFIGVDGHGRLCLKDAGGLHMYDASDIELLREIEPS